MLALHPSATPVARTAKHWLLVCAAAVFMMALIGAVTRLTESGLSIVEWKPITGALPPLSEAAWQAEYHLYQQSPQGEIINRGMSMEDFKYIYFWEWLHRLWGRLIGVIYALPLIILWRRLPVETKPALLGLLALGGAQACMGWFMVKSGLVDQPMVSHYRLAAHLSLAALIYALLLRQALIFQGPAVTAMASADSRRLRRFSLTTLAMVAITIVWGAFVAGLDAGMLYNTFPTMDGHWLPPELDDHRPLWHGFVAEPAIVQFTHRVLAVLTLVKVLALWRLSRRLLVAEQVRRIATYAALAVGAQVLLGIATLMTQVQIGLATLHQGGAFILLGVLTWLIYHLSPRQERTA